MSENIRLNCKFKMYIRTTKLSFGPKLGVFLITFLQQKTKNTPLPSFSLSPMCVLPTCAFFVSQLVVLRMIAERRKGNKRDRAIFFVLSKTRGMSFALAPHTHNERRHFVFNCHSERRVYAEPNTTCTLSDVLSVLAMRLTRYEIKRNLLLYSTYHVASSRFWRQNAVQLEQRMNVKSGKSTQLRLRIDLLIRFHPDCELTE